MRLAFDLADMLVSCSHHDATVCFLFRFLRLRPFCDVMTVWLQSGSIAAAEPPPSLTLALAGGNTLPWTDCHGFCDASANTNPRRLLASFAIGFSLWGWAVGPRLPVDGSSPNVNQ